ncbi:MAG: hypothetical protein V7L23_02425 [Nostoc sp.]
MTIHVLHKPLQAACKAAFQHDCDSEVLFSSVLADVLSKQVWRT